MRTQLYRSLAVGLYWRKKAWQDDKKLTFEDLDETAKAVVALGFIWGGNKLLANLPAIKVVEGLVLSGAVVSFAIAGEKGFDDYVDFMTGEVSPKEFGEVVQAELIQPAKKYIMEELWEEQLVKPVTSWVNRRIDELELVWSITKPRFSLPF